MWPPKAATLITFTICCLRGGAEPSLQRQRSRPLAGVNLAAAKKSTLGKRHGCEVVETWWCQIHDDVVVALFLVHARTDDPSWTKLSHARAGGTINQLNSPAKFHGKDGVQVATEEAKR